MRLSAEFVEPRGLLYNDRRTLTLPRPAFLVAEPEPEQALSTRKLLLETFKFNVITAHSERETIDLLHLFPNDQCPDPALWDSKTSTPRTSSAS